MNSKLPQKEVQDFIAENWNTDSFGLLLKKQIFEDISQQELVAQLECKKKAKDKLPSWFKQHGIVYPTKLNMEQTSSEITAAYKSGLVSGKHLVDITGGFGIDSFYFSKKVEEIVHCEINSGLSQIAKHNFEVLGAQNISTIAIDGISYLENLKKSFDWIYIDPSRRNAAKKKVFQLKEYQPNVPKNLNLLFEKADNILIKTSPMLDISSGIREMDFVKEVHVVAVRNEVKELLWVLQKGVAGETLVKTVNLLPKGNQTFDFYLSKEKKAVIDFAEPENYLFEPNAAILKSGAFKHIGNLFDLKKLAEHTHLYTSDEVVDFPGRIFKITAVFPFNKKSIKKKGLVKANIATRNFPISVEQLKKDLKITDGGENYLFFTQNFQGRKIVILAEKIGLSRIMH